jgi:hypothetical protein
MNVNHKLEFGLRNIPQLLAEWGRSDTDPEAFGAAFIDFLKEAIPSVAGEQDSVLHNLKETATDTVSFDQMTRRSIVEIIPGYLSRILQQAEISNTGDPDRERLVYSVDTEEFTTLSNAVNTVRDKLFSDDDAASSAEAAMSAVDAIDEEGVLSSEARKTLGMQMLRDANNGLRFNPLRYGDEYGYSSEVSESFIEEIQSLLHDRYGYEKEYYDEDGTHHKAIVGKSLAVNEEINRDDREFGKLRDRSYNIQEDLNVYNATGDKELARLAGIIENSGGSDKVMHDDLWKKIEANVKDRARVTEEVTEENRDDFTVDLDSDSRDDDLERLAMSHEPPEGYVEEEIEPETNDGRGIVSRFRDRVLGRSDEPVDTQTLSRAPLVRTDNSSVVESLRELITCVKDIKGKMGSGSNMGAASVDLSGIKDYTDPLNTIISRLDTLVKESTEIKNRTGVILADENGRPVTGTYGLLTGVGSLAASAGKGVGKVLGGVGSMYSTIGKGMGTVATATGGAVSKTYEKVKEKLTEFKEGDIYVGGFKFPALKAKLFKAGEYIDGETGKIITSLEDIKGEVKDKAGNIILSAEDYAKGLFQADGKSVGAGMLEWARTKPIEYLKNYYSKVFDWGGKAVNLGKDIYKGVERYFNKISDIYVKGEPESPVMLKQLMEKGLYFSKKTGEPIRSFKDIDGEVVDGDGNIVLSNEQLNKGLVDAEGKDIEFKSLKDLAIDKTIGFATSGWKVGGKMVGAMRKLAEGAFNNARDAFNRVVSWFTEDSQIFDGIMDIDKLRVNATTVHLYTDGGVRTFGTEGTGDSKMDKAMSDFVGPVLPDRLKETSETFVGPVLPQSMRESSDTFVGPKRPTMENTPRTATNKIKEEESKVTPTKTNKIDAVVSEVTESESVKKVVESTIEAKDKVIVTATELKDKAVEQANSKIEELKESDKYKDAKEKVEEIKEKAEAKASVIKDSVLEAIENRPKTIEETKEIVSEKAKEVADKAKATGTELVDSIKDTASKKTESLKELVESTETGKRVVDGVRDGYIKSLEKIGLTEKDADEIDSVDDGSGSISDSVKKRYAKTKAILKRKIASGEIDDPEIIKEVSVDVEPAKSKSIFGTMRDKIKDRIVSSVPELDILSSSDTDTPAKEMDNDTKDNVESIFSRTMGKLNAGLSRLAGSVDQLNEEGLEIDQESLDDAMDRVTSDFTGDDEVEGVSGDSDGDGVRDGSYLDQRSGEETESNDSKGILEGIKELMSRRSSEGGQEEKKPGILDKAKDWLGGKTKGLLGKAGRGLLSVGGMALKGAGSAAMGAGKLALGAAKLAAPVLGRVASMALGPVGLGLTALYGGYKAAEYIGERLDPEPLEKLRFAQYGIDTEDGDQLQAIRRLEDVAYDEVTYNENGDASLPDDFISKELMNDHLDDFGLDPTLMDDVNYFLEWYRNTFRPTLLTHASATYRADEDVDLLDIDDELDDEYKGPFADAVHKEDQNRPAVRSSSGFKEFPIVQQTDQAYNEVLTDLGIETEESKTKAKSEKAENAPQDDKKPTKDTSGFLAGTNAKQITEQVKEASTPPKLREVIKESEVVAQQDKAFEEMLYKVAPAAAVTAGTIATSTPTLPTGVSESISPTISEATLVNDAVVLEDVAGSVVDATMAPTVTEMTTSTAMDTIEEQAVEEDEVVSTMDVVKEMREQRVEAVAVQRQAGINAGTQQMSNIEYTLSRSLAVQTSMDRHLKEISEGMSILVEAQEEKDDSDSWFGASENEDQKKRKEEIVKRTKELMASRNKKAAKPPVNMANRAV